MARAGKVTLSPLAGSAPGAAAGVAVLAGAAAGVAVRAGVACADTPVGLDVPTANAMMRPATMRAPPETSSHLLKFLVSVAIAPPLCSLAPPCHTPCPTHDADVREAGIERGHRDRLVKAGYRTLPIRSRPGVRSLSPRSHRRYPPNPDLVAGYRSIYRT